MIRGYDGNDIMEISCLYKGTWQGLTGMIWKYKWNTMDYHVHAMGMSWKGPPVPPKNDEIPSSCALILLYSNNIGKPQSMIASSLLRFFKL